MLTCVPQPLTSQTSLHIDISRCCSAVVLVCLPHRRARPAAESRAPAKKRCMQHCTARGTVPSMYTTLHRGLHPGLCSRVTLHCMQCTEHYIPNTACCVPNTVNPVQCADCTCSTVQVAVPSTARCCCAQYCHSVAVPSIARCCCAQYCTGLQYPASPLFSRSSSTIASSCEIVSEISPSKSSPELPSKNVHVCTHVYAHVHTHVCTQACHSKSSAGLRLRHALAVFFVSIFSCAGTSLTTCKEQWYRQSCEQAK